MKDSFVVRLAACYILLSILPFTAIFSQNAAPGDFFENIENENPKPKVKAIFSFSGGVAFLADNGSSPVDYYEPKSSFQLSALAILGKFTGLRLDMGYSNWLRDDYKINTVANYYFYGQRTKDCYYIKTDFVFGSFASSNKFWFNLSAGLGLNFLKHSSYKYTYTYWEITFPNEKTIYYPSENRNAGILSFGSAFGYRFTKLLGAYVDIQFSNAAGSGYSFFGKNDESYIPVRAGITYTIY